MTKYYCPKCGAELFSNWNEGNFWCSSDICDYSKNIEHPKEINDLEQTWEQLKQNYLKICQYDKTGLLK